MYGKLPTPVNAKEESPSQLYGRLAVICMGAPTVICMGVLCQLLPAVICMGLAVICMGVPPPHSQLYGARSDLYGVPPPPQSIVWGALPQEPPIHITATLPYKTLPARHTNHCHSPIQITASQSPIQITASLPYKCVLRGILRIPYLLSVDRETAGVDSLEVMISH